MVKQSRLSYVYANELISQINLHINISLNI
jgi:hypothetical protein